MRLDFWLTVVDIGTLIIPMLTPPMGISSIGESSIGLPLALGDSRLTSLNGTSGGGENASTALRFVVEGLVGDVYVGGGRR